MRLKSKNNLPNKFEKFAALYLDDGFYIRRFAKKIEKLKKIITFQHWS